MSQIVDTNGNMIIYQGDDFIIPLENLPAENLTLYAAVYNSNRKQIGTEQSVSTLSATSIDILMPSTLSDLMTVPNNQDYEIYYYGVKSVDANGKESTFFIGPNAEFGTLNTITVYPRKVVGA